MAINVEWVDIAIDMQQEHIRHPKQSLQTHNN